MELRTHKECVKSNRHELGHLDWISSGFGHALMLEVHRLGVFLVQAASVGPME